MPTKKELQTALILEHNANTDKEELQRASSEHIQDIVGFNGSMLYNRDIGKHE